MNSKNKELNKTFGKTNPLSKSQEVSLDTQNPISSLRGVKKGFESTTRIKIQTILNATGRKWVEVYQDIGLSKSHASMILNEHIIPPLWLRVKICKGLGIDTSVIWNFPQIQSADKIQGERQDKASSNSQEQRKREEIENE